MARIIDLTGRRFEKLTVIKRVGTYISPQNSKSPLWLCKCECGKELEVIGRDLKTGNTKSCGCFKTEKLNNNSFKHGLSNSRLYQVWRGIKERCYLSSSRSYKTYGAKGIKMCDEWRESFQAFYDWATSNGYKEKLLPNGRNEFSIDRIDPNGDYEPSNCRWISLSENVKKSFRDRRGNL